MGLVEAPIRQECIKCTEVARQSGDAIFLWQVEHWTYVLHSTLYRAHQYMSVSYRNLEVSPRTKGAWSFLLPHRFSLGCEAQRFLWLFEVKWHSHSK